MKNSSHTIGNQIRDVPVCNAVPQPTPYSVSCRTSFRHVHKIVKSDCWLFHVCPLVSKFYMEQLDSQWEDFHEN